MENYHKRQLATAYQNRYSVKKPSEQWIGVHRVKKPKEKTVKKSISLKFTEWLGFHYVRLNGFWCHRYRDQRNEENWKTTEELFVHFETIHKFITGKRADTGCNRFRNEVIINPFGLIEKSDAITRLIKLAKAGENEPAELRPA